MVPRSDLATDQAAQNFRYGLVPGFSVLPRMRQAGPLGEPVPGSASTIVVGTGSNRIQQVQVTILHPACLSEIRINLGRLSDLVLNTFVIAGRIRQLLATALGPGLPLAGVSIR
jgi:hypothetical protein